MFWCTPIRISPPTFPWRIFFAPDVLLATHHNGNALSSPHGGPVRLVVPRLYFWKSAKWVTGLEFLAEDKRGFWESAGYHNHGDPGRKNVTAGRRI
nr:molybdopterin-dependent oxidoreductase [Methanobacterium formicicum]